MSEQDQPKYDDIGAIWIKDDRNNAEYLSMTITINGKQMYFAAFPNRKGKPSHPDYRIYRTGKGSGRKRTRRRTSDDPDTGDDSSP